MIGESGYSVNQWLAAATCPPHLSCVLIYNGFTDLYRDAIYHGGIFSMGFYNFWTVDNVRASATVGGGIPPRPGGVDVDLMGLALNHAEDSDFWRERAADVAAITVPTVLLRHKVGGDLYYHDAEHPSHVLLPIVPRVAP
jgi:predicted acyl esterase